MENLVCHFHEIRNVESTTSIRTGMSMELIKMKMSNEAESILSHLNDHNPPKPPQRKKRLRKKLYKYPCSVSMQLSMCGYALDGVRRRGQARFGDFDIFCPNNFQICHPSLDTEIGKKKSKSLHWGKWVWSFITKCQNSPCTPGTLQKIKIPTLGTALIVKFPWLARHPSSSWALCWKVHWENAN